VLPALVQRGYERRLPTNRHTTVRASAAKAANNVASSTWSLVDVPLQIAAPSERR
jgi:hypothetical protein